MNDATDTRTPRELIEYIRREEYGVDVDASEQEQRRSKNLRKKLDRALAILSTDLYSKQTHFILELIQNADDNSYPKGVVPRLSLNLSPTRLLLVNNERGFSERHVHALCDVGKSSKDKKKGYIGEKGIGFKSVFTVSDAPEIHSNDYHFRFNRAGENNLLGYVVPEWCTPSEKIDSDATTIILPAKQGKPFSGATLGDLDAELLLFLSNLRELELWHDGISTIFKRSEKAEFTNLIKTVVLPNGKTQTEEAHFLRVSMTISMEDAADEKRPDIDTSEIVLAFPISLEGLASPQSGSHVFAFLPISPFGFKFSVQADFILSSSREAIHIERIWNKHLRGSIAKVFIKAVEAFQKTDGLAFSYLNFLPTESEIVDPFFKPIVSQIIALLTETKCLPSAGGNWMIPRELKYGNKRFQELFPPLTAQQLFGFDYVDSRAAEDEKILQRLGAKPITYHDFVDVFKHHGDWFIEQPKEWRASFYACLANLDRASLFKAGLMSTPCVPTSTETLVIPAKTNSFYPLSRKRMYGFEEELTIVDNELLEMAKQNSAHTEEFFTALNVKKDDPFELVNSHILPRHKDKDWQSSEWKALIGHLRYIKHKLDLYLSGAMRVGKSQEDAIKAIREGLWLGTKDHSEKTWTFNRASNLYISKEYMPQFCIESALGDAIANRLLVSAEYLPDKIRDAESEANSWRQFLIRIGVGDAPKVEKLSDGDVQCTAELSALMDSTQRSVRKATLECLDRHWHLYSGSLTFGAMSSRRYFSKDTKFAIALRSMIAPTSKLVKIPISDAYYPNNELMDLFGDAPIYISAKLKNEEFLEACHLTFRVDVSACVKRLKQLKNEGGDTTPKLSAIYRHLESLWDKDGDVIKNAFSQEGLIRIKGPHGKWATADEVAWSSNGRFLDSLYPPLLNQYRDFSAFFTKKLGVPRQLPTAKMVAALSQLGEIESSEERAQEALAIYKRASRDLTSRPGERMDALPEWLETFQLEEVFLNQHGDLVANDESLFANDSPELGALFASDPEISLLAVPFEDLPRVRPLLDALEIQSLERTVEVDVVEAHGSQHMEDLTAEVRSMVVFIGRALYHSSHLRFESALKRGLFQRLRELEIVEVPDLQLEVTVASVSRRASRDIAAKGNRILVKRGAKSVKDQVANEICKLLEAPDTLADTISRLLLANDAEEAENFLQVKRISPLPLDMEKSLWGEEQFSLEPDLEDVPQDDIQAPEESQASGMGRDENSITGEAGTGLEGIQRTEPNTFRSPAARGPTDTPPTSTEHRTETREKDHLGSASVLRGSAVLGPDIENTGAIAPVQAKPHRPAEVNPGFERPVRGASGRSDRKRGQTARTNSGRLMSYAASPAEAERISKEEDPARAAARDATAQAAVNYFVTTQFKRWKSLLTMPHNNPGFDVKATSHDDQDEFIEVKGQSAAWTEDGVALTPTELAEARRQGERYWLCVVEYATDEKRRKLYLIKNPHGLTQQFRFDSGWKSAAISEETRPTRPEAGLVIDLPGFGKGRIISVRKKGEYYKVHALLESGKQVNKTFNPATMKLSTE